jgi:bis(5'-nucleosyl)-tetraphosphatase (symmetrical)
MASLARLLAKIGYAPARDRLWLVGDLVNRGPRSLDVLRWARDQGDAVTAVLGNHDLHLLARAAGAGAKKRDTLDEVLAAPDRDALLTWLRTRPLCHVEDGHVLIHAGLHPRWTVATARALAAEVEAGLRGPGWATMVASLSGAAAPWDDALRGAARARAILAYLVRVRTGHADGRIEADFDGAPADAPTGCVPWFALPHPAWATHTAVFGHWAALGLAIGPRHLGLDTGCVWGKALTAIRLDDRAVFQVAAVEA